MDHEKNRSDYGGQTLWRSNANGEWGDVQKLEQIFESGVFGCNDKSEWDCGAEGSGSLADYGMEATNDDEEARME